MGVAASRGYERALATENRVGEERGDRGISWGERAGGVKKKKKKNDHRAEHLRIGWIKGCTEKERKAVSYLLKQRTAALQLRYETGRAGAHGIVSAERAVDLTFGIGILKAG